MTNRFHSLTVVLDSDIREDDAQMIIDAIKQLRCVTSVTGNVNSLTDHVAEMRVREELRQKLFDVLS